MPGTITSISYLQKHQLDPNPTAHIETSSLEYLHAAFLLYEYKTTYSKKEYRTLLDTYGWDKGSSEEKQALKIAENFQEFLTCPQHLAAIPVTILLRLCSPQYKPIISQLQDYPIGGLTCKLVLELIEERKALLKTQKQEQQKQISIWRRTPKGDRYCQFPPQWEEDHQTGVLTQELIDGYGLLPQQILREAIADYHAKIKSQEKEQSQEETAESKVLESSMIPQLETSPTEIEKALEVNPRLKQNEQTSTSNATEQQPVGEEVLMLTEKLKSATSYYQIRSAIYRHLAVKDEAWKQLSPEEQLRIKRLFPQEILALQTAREACLIIDYYELETGWFQVFIAGEDKPVSISKSNLISWVQEQERLNCVTT
ncbi:MULTISPECIES: hypothetical protein [Nostocales]|uniref:hypothetical protein n=1 Tax=Nostocales TaxID=1161 RepID=UPI0005EAA624|nr:MULTISPECIES: hypothetical protein [Nostocales]BAY95050.1 hypothetical protein NIES3275_71070 [Microchaete diplosiphon NIES-3275]EKE98021.1 hypothetical protein FDUTEX481_04590 [Tolypothrix sp. PCC 7601]MBE9080614.1 hypothetical protein [Tolypothrix sp. LEGE 11397]UYD30425.1 hypothetical protein HGR01_36115 [Tolypothrix sp. PCC 7712]UYD38134.1 hypothetical protein HG267_37140 [Tolypothrix sp. PCC 7601]